MEANSRCSATTAGTSVRSIIHQAIVSQTKKPHCYEQAASSCIPFNQQGNDMKVYIQPIYNRKEYLPLTLHFFADELEGFDRLSKKLGISPPALLKKAIDLGMPKAVASMEDNKKATKHTNKG